MSYREKMAWIQLVATLAAYGVYFAIAFPRIADGRGDGLFGLFVGLTVVLCLLTAVPTIFVSLRTPRREVDHADERERLIALVSARYAGIVLTSLVWAGVGGLLIGVDPFLMAHLLLAVLVLSELVRWTAEIVQLRRIG